MPGSFTSGSASASTSASHPCRLSPSRAHRKKAIAARKAGHQVVVVVSAMSGETNRLLKLVNGITAAVESADALELALTGKDDL